MNPKSFIDSESDLSEPTQPLKSPAKSALSAQFKNIRVLFENSIEVEVHIFRSEEQNLTCEWFHQEVIKKINDELTLHEEVFKRVKQIVLESSPPNILLDYWLSLPKKSIFLLRDGQTFLAKETQPKKSTAVEEDDKSLSLNDFDVLSKIGWGKTSTVYLARDKSNGIFYAIKQIRKGVLDDPKIEKKLRYMERNNSIALRKPFLVNLQYTFQSDTCFYFVMDYLPGGNLKKVLHQKGTFSEEEAKFYVAEILTGLDIIHESGFIYRDLKTENILIDDGGHIKICDFVKSKKFKSKLDLNYSPVVSPRICSPEIVHGKGYNVMTDYYSLGVLVYELIIGRPPHKSYGGDFKETARKITSENPTFPEYVSKELEDFITGLLCKDADFRLGAQKGIEEIKNHPWLKGVNFEKISAHLVPPPIDTFDLIFEQNLMPVNQDVDMLQNSEDQDETYSLLMFFDYNSDEADEKKKLKFNIAPEHNYFVRRKISTPTLTPTMMFQAGKKSEFRKHSSDLYTKASTNTLASKPILKPFQDHSPIAAKGDSGICFSNENKSKTLGISEGNFGSMNEQISFSEIDDGESQAHLTESYKLVPKMGMSTNNGATSRNSTVLTTNFKAK